MERANGLRINREKTEILLLSPEIAVSKEELDVKEIRMAVKILGIHFTYEFLWKGKDKVKRTAVISDIRDGGLRMVDIETMIKGTANNGCQKISG